MLLNACEQLVIDPITRQRKLRRPSEPTCHRWGDILGEIFPLKVPSRWGWEPPWGFVGWLEAWMLAVVFLYLKFSTWDFFVGDFWGLVLTRMSQEMKSKWSGSMGYFSHTYTWGILGLYNPLILTFDPNFQRDIQVTLPEFERGPYVKRKGNYSLPFGVVLQWDWEHNMACGMF